MNEQKTGGGILILLAAGCIFYGVNRMNSFASQVAGFFGVQDTTAIAAIALGVLVGIVGAVFLTRQTE